MSSGTFVAIYLSTAILIILAMVGIVYVMAKMKILFFFPKEGQIYTIMKGGKFHKFQAYVAGWKLDRQRDNFDHMVEVDNPQDHDDSIPWYTHLFGIALIGIPPIYKIYEYPFEWVKMGKKHDGTSFELISREEESVDSLFFQFPYAFEIKEAETQDNVPVTAQVLATVQILVPYKTLFMTHDWLAQLSGYINDKVKVLIGDKPISQVQKIGEEDFQKAILSLNMRAEGAEGLTRLIGINILDADFVGYDIVTDEETKKALQAVEVAKQKAEARRIEADAEGHYLERTVGYVAGDDPARRIDAAKWAGPKRLPDVYVEGSQGGSGDRPSIVLPSTKKDE